MRFRLTPEVAGGFGERTALDRSVWPPRAQAFHYEFAGWLGNSIIEAVANYIVTESLAEDLTRQKFTGFRVGDLEVTLAEEFFSSAADEAGGLPKFVWLQITGDQHDDFYRESDRNLSVSKEALDVIRSHGAPDLMVKPVEIDE